MVVAIFSSYVDEELNGIWLGKVILGDVNDGQ